MNQYKHQWSFARKLTMTEWATVRTVANDMMAACPEHDAKGRPLRGTLLTIQRAATGTAEVFLSHTQPRVDVWTDEDVYQISFRSPDDFSETFAMRNETLQRMVNTFGQPYEDLVLGLFVLIKHLYGPLLQVDSSADLNDWGRGLRIARMVDSSVRLHPDLVPGPEADRRLDLSSITINRPVTLDFRG